MGQGLIYTLEIISTELQECKNRVFIFTLFSVKSSGTFCVCLNLHFLSLRDFVSNFGVKMKSYIDICKHKYYG